MHERYKVTRVKTDGQFGRTSYVRPKGDKFDEGFEEHSMIVRRTLKSIWCGSQTKDESKRNGQKRAAKLHLSGFSLEIYLAMPKRSVAAAPNISMN